MAKQSKSPLEEKFQALPRSVSYEKHIKPILSKAGISGRTFERDRKRKGSSIPHERLQVYAALFGCQVSDLVDTSVNVPSVVKTSFATKVGLKS